MWLLGLQEVEAWSRFFKVQSDDQIILLSSFEQWCFEAFGSFAVFVSFSTCLEASLTLASSVCGVFDTGEIRLARGRLLLLARRMLALPLVSMTKEEPRLSLDGVHGLASWRCMFIVGGVLTIVVAIWSLMFFLDTLKMTTGFI